jgi:hypothetical protein
MAGLYDLTEMLGITGVVVKTIFVAVAVLLALFGMAALQQGQLLSGVLMFALALGGGVVLRDLH